MSWHFSLALAVAFSEENSSDGELSALLKSTPMPQAFLSPDRMTAFSRLSLFGMTLAPLTDGLGEELLTWFLAGFPAKTSVSPGGVKESQASEVDFGNSLPASFTKFDPGTSSWRTHQFSLLGGLEPYSETWPRWGILHDGECSELAMPGHLINANESGSWPTPHGFSPDGKTNGPSGNELGRAVNRSMVPTPTAQDAKNCTLPPSQRGRDSIPGYPLRQWSTPTCRDANTVKKVMRGAGSLAKGNQMVEPLVVQAVNSQPSSGGSLNPMWVEWLMGWPLGWTDCAVSGMDKFRQWSGLHGKPLMEDPSNGR